MVAQYPDMLAGGITEQTPLEIFQLYAGESDVVTDRGFFPQAVGVKGAPFVVLANNEAGELVAWTPGAGAASAVLNFTGVGTAADTITINGQAITLVALADADTPFEAAIGATPTLTAQNVRTVINNNQEVFEVEATGAAASLTLTALEAGPGGNTIAVAEAGTGTNFTGGVTTLAGGSTESESKAVGISAQPIGPNSWGPYFTGGVFNHAAITWPAGVDTLAQRKRVFAGSNISVARLL